MKLPIDRAKNFLIHADRDIDDIDIDYISSSEAETIVKEVRRWIKKYIQSFE